MHHGSNAAGFPVDLCARILQWGDGGLVQLHPGLLENPADDLPSAQRRAVEHLWSCLPPPCRVLQLGVRSGDLLRRLGASGFDARGVSLEPELLAAARAKPGPPIDLARGDLAELATPEQPFECLVLHDALSGMRPLALFEAADRLMVPADAQMLLMGAFELRRSGPGLPGPHLWSTFLALSRRFGWCVARDEDLSAAVAPGIDALAALLQLHRARLQAELAMDPAHLQAHIHDVRRAAVAYAEGQCSYRLLRLHRPARPATRLRSVHSRDSEAVRALFPDRFGHALSAEEWWWKYGDGRGRAVGLFRGDDLVAHCGGMNRPVLLMGEPAMACQVGDVMVLPEAIAGLARTNALHQVTATFLEAHMGWGEFYVGGFGFPNSRHMKLAVRLNLYAPVDEVQQLSWTAWPQDPYEHPAEPLDAAALQEGTPAWQALLAHWRTMAGACIDRALCIRDPAWLHHRYGRRPQCPYLLHQVFGREGEPLGVAVMRVLPHALELSDLIGHPRHFRLMVSHVRCVAQQMGRERVETWVTASHANWLSDPADPAHVQQIQVTVPANVHTPGYEPARLKGRWFLMGGDTDFR